MAQQEDLLSDLLVDFVEAQKKILDTKIQAGDAQKPHAYIAAKAFRSPQSYRHWLDEGQASLSGHTPLSVLAEDRESVQVKNLMLVRILEREGYLVPASQLYMIFETEASHSKNTGKNLG